MPTSEKHPGSITFLLVGIIMLVTAGGLILGFVPSVKCPICRGCPQRGFILKDGSKLPWRQVEEVTIDHLICKTDEGTPRRVARDDVLGKWMCDRCGGRSRVSLFNRCIR